MNITYLFAYRMIRSGGTENLIRKMSINIRQRNKCIIRCVCERCSEELRKELMDNNVIVDEISWDDCTNYIINCDKKNELRVVTFEWDVFITFILCERQLKKTLLYAVHPECIRGNWESQNSVDYHKDLRKYNRRSLSDFVMRMTLAGHIIVMDEVVCEETERFFNKAIPFNIVRICVDIKDKWEEIAPQIKERYENRIITTAARADFPFKGYIFGLIEWFLNKVDEYQKLVVVCYGADRKQLDEYWERLPAKAKEKIIIADERTYEGLREILNTSFVYVGMGTSILDAATMGVPSIPVEPFVYNVMTNSRFDENPNSVCAAKIYKYQDFTLMMNKLYSTNYDEYLSISNRSYESVVEKYSVSKVVDQLISAINTSNYDYENDISIENDSFICFKKELSMIKHNAYGRKIAIYGAGIGGRDILLKAENTIEIDCFIDAKAQSNQDIYGVPVYSPGIIDKNKYYVIISLKKYTKDIPEYLERKGYKQGKDYVYLYSEMEK